MAVPCRYLHSPASVIELSDYHHLVDLTSAFLSELTEGGLTNNEKHIATANICLRTSGKEEEIRSVLKEELAVTGLQLKTDALGI